MLLKKRKLVFFSGGHFSQNKELLQESFVLLDQGRSGSFSFIPSNSKTEKSDFLSLEKIYSKHKKIKKFTYFPVDEHFSDKKIDGVFKSSVIFLSGGNTFIFLDYLRKRRLLGKLKKFVSEGGTLMGMSAGGIIMTASILMAAFPPKDADENTPNMEKLKGLNLVNFEFCPHFANSKKMKEEMLAYTSLYPRPLVAVKDGGGVIVSGSTVKFVGNHKFFANGKELNFL